MGCRFPFNKFRLLTVYRVFLWGRLLAERKMYSQPNVSTLIVLCFCVSDLHLARGEDKSLICNSHFYYVVLQDRIVSTNGKEKKVKQLVEALPLVQSEVFLWPDRAVSCREKKRRCSKKTHLNWTDAHKPFTCRRQGSNTGPSSIPGSGTRDDNRWR